MPINIFSHCFDDESDEGDAEGEPDVEGSDKDEESSDEDEESSSNLDYEERELQRLKLAFWTKDHLKKVPIGC